MQAPGLTSQLRAIPETKLSQANQLRHHRVSLSQLTRPLPGTTWMGSLQLLHSGDHTASSTLARTYHHMSLAVWKGTEKKEPNLECLPTASGPVNSTGHVHVAPQAKDARCSTSVPGLKRRAGALSDLVRHSTTKEVQAAGAKTGFYLRKPPESPATAAPLDSPPGLLQHSAVIRRPLHHHQTTHSRSRVAAPIAPIGGVPHP